MRPPQTAHQANATTSPIPDPPRNKCHCRLFNSDPFHETNHRENADKRLLIKELRAKYRNRHSPRTPLPHTPSCTFRVDWAPARSPTSRFAGSRASTSSDCWSYRRRSPTSSWTTSSSPPARSTQSSSSSPRRRRGRRWPASIRSGPRDRIVKALGYLEEAGDLVLRASGARQGYRALQTPCDRHALGQTLGARFAQREEHDISRLRRMCEWAEHDGCLTTKYLLDYFGETRNDCGHRSRCERKATPPWAAANPAPNLLPRHRRSARFTLACGLVCASPVRAAGRLTPRHAGGEVIRLGGEAGFAVVQPPPVMPADRRGIRNRAR